MKNKLGDRLKELREERNLSQTEVANKIGITKQNLYKYENGIIENIPRDKIEALANYYDVSPSLIMGRNDSLEGIPGINPIHKINRIPILGDIACGEPILCKENFEGYVITDPSMIAADFSIYADGDSMIDANIQDGDLVFIKQTPVVENGAICAVLIDDSATLKRFYKTDDQIILQPENNNYQPIIITEEDMRDVRILGEMVGVYSRRNK